MENVHSAMGIEVPLVHLRTKINFIAKKLFNAFFSMENKGVLVFHLKRKHKIISCFLETKTVPIENKSSLMHR